MKVIPQLLVCNQHLPGKHPSYTLANFLLFHHLKLITMEENRRAILRRLAQQMRRARQTEEQREEQRRINTERRRELRLAQSEERRRQILAEDAIRHRNAREHMSKEQRERIRQQDAVRRRRVRQMNQRQEKAGISRAEADVASSLVTDPVWSDQENALGSNEEIIEKKLSKSKEIETEQSSSDEYLDGNESKVYIDVAEHPEDLRKRKHFMGDWEEFPSDIDGKKYIKSEDDTDEKIDISKEYMFAEPYEEQETLRDWTQVTDVSLTNIKQEPDSGDIVWMREMP